MGNVIENKASFLQELRPEGSFVKTSRKTIGKAAVAGTVAFLAGYIFAPIIAVPVTVARGIKILHDRHKEMYPGALNTQLSVLGEAAPEIVFNPLLVLMAKLNGPMQKRGKDFIEHKMKVWGYSSDYINQYITGTWAKTSFTGKIDSKELNKSDLCKKSDKLRQELHNYLGFEI